MSQTTPVGMGLIHDAIVKFRVCSVWRPGCQGQVFTRTPGCQACDAERYCSSCFGILTDLLAVTCLVCDPHLGARLNITGCFMPSKAGNKYLQHISPHPPSSIISLSVVQEWRSFQAEIGCQPLHLACLACGSEVERLLKEGAKDKAKVVQQLAADIAPWFWALPGGPGGWVEKVGNPTNIY